MVRSQENNFPCGGNVRYVDGCRILNDMNDEVGCVGSGCDNTYHYYVYPSLLCCCAHSNSVGYGNVRWWSKRMGGLM